MKYRSKPSACEAVQFDPLGAHKMTLPPGVTGVPSPGADNWAYAGCEFWVVTAHGQRTRVVAGDYVVTEPDGRGHYPVKPDIFETRWERDE